MKRSKQFWFVFLLVMFCTIAVSIFNLYSYRANLIESSRHEIESVLNFTRAQVAVYVDKQKKGLITKEDAEKHVIEMLSAMQVDTRYVWANDNNAIARVHVRPEKIGKFQESYVYHMRQLEDAPIAFVSRPNVKPIENVRVLKINGVTKVADWDWVIGYGTYVDEIENEFLGIVIKTVLVNILIAIVAAFVTLFWMRLKLIRN